MHPLGFGLGWKFQHHLVHFVNCDVSYCSHPSVGGGYLLSVVSIMIWNSVNGVLSSWKG